LSLGLFANGSYGDGFNGVPGKVTGLFFGNSSQFFAECIGVVVNFIYVGGMTAVALFAIGKLVGNRVSREDEIAGLDIPEMGILAYPDDAAVRAPDDGPESISTGVGAESLGEVAG
jgi:Amt family ammonium transporter